jgi:hypothetical protein
MPETDLLTELETAGVRRCSTRKLQRDRAEGRGCPYVRIDGRIFYRRKDVEQFIAAHVRGCPHTDANMSSCPINASDHKQAQTPRPRLGNVHLRAECGDNQLSALLDGRASASHRQQISVAQLRRPIATTRLDDEIVF